MSDYPYNAVLGHVLHGRLSKDMCVALVVDLIRATQGESLSDDEIRREIVSRVDTLHSAGIVPRRLPRYLERREDEWTDDTEPSGAALITIRPVHADCGQEHSIGTACP